VTANHAGPPQFSSANSGLNRRATNGAIFFMSYVRTRVASSDWCASRNVVSISSNLLWALTAAANPSGPFSRNTSFQPLASLSAEAATFQHHTHLSAWTKPLKLQMKNTQSKHHIQHIHSNMVLQNGEQLKINDSILVRVTHSQSTGFGS